jgi:hypothetical protein
MSKYLGSLVVVVMGIACGGTTDTGDESGGGTSSGGKNGGGQSSGGSSKGGSVGTSGSVGTGGSVGTSGSVGTGGSIGIAGSIGVGGTLVTAGTGGVGGLGTVDPRCPAQRPTGACTPEEAGVSCQYDQYTGCLCYSNPAILYGLCNKVDPTCPSGGAAAAPAPAPADGGIGGISAKIAVPPHQICSCSGGSWLCTFGF